MAFDPFQVEYGILQGLSKFLITCKNIHQHHNYNCLYIIYDRILAIVLIDKFSENFTLSVGFVDIVIVEPISVDKFKIHNITLCKNSLLNDKNIQNLYVEALGNVEFEDNVILKKVHEGITNTTENEIYEEYINCLIELS